MTKTTDLAQLLTEYGYTDKSGYRFTRVLADGTRVNEGKSTYENASLVIESIIHSNSDCDLLVEGLASEIAFWINIPKKVIEAQTTEHIEEDEETLEMAYLMKRQSYSYLLNHSSIRF